MRNKKRSENVAVADRPVSNWWKKENAMQIKALSRDRKFIKIICFYVLNCPAICAKDKKAKRKVSVLAKTFYDYGIEKNQMGNFLKKLCKELDYCVCGKSEKVKEKWNEKERTTHNSDPEYEMVIIKENTEIGQTNSLFYFIRNALAHGSFSVCKIKRGRKYEKIYYLENISKGEVWARMRLRESTLLNWMKLFEEAKH